LLDAQQVQLPLKPLALKALRKLANDKETPMTLDSLDGFVHNKNIEPTEKELRAIWTTLEPLFAAMLTDAEPTTTK
jgi:hypothetical protein